MSYKHFTRQERDDISHLKDSVSLREIGRRLGRSHSSISRELKRNRPTSASDEYRGDDAHNKALHRQALPRHYL